MEQMNERRNKGRNEGREKKERKKRKTRKFTCCAFSFPTFTHNLDLIPSFVMRGSNLGFILWQSAYQEVTE